MVTGFSAVDRQTGRRAIMRIQYSRRQGFIIDRQDVLKTVLLLVFVAVVIIILTTTGFSEELDLRYIPQQKSNINNLTFSTKRYISFSIPHYTMSANERLIADTSLLSTFAAIDYTQSVEMFFHRKGYRELNPILGEHPSRQRMALFGLVSVAAVFIIAKALPNSWSRVFIDSVTASEVMNIEENRQLMDGYTVSGPPVRGRVFQSIPIVIHFRF